MRQNHKQAFVVQHTTFGTAHRSQAESSYRVVFDLQEGEQSFFEDVQNGGKEEGQCQENEQFISELSPVVLGNELPPQLDGSRHAFKFIIGLLDRPRRGSFQQNKGGEKSQAFMDNLSLAYLLERRNRNFATLCFSIGSDFFIYLMRSLSPHSAEPAAPSCG